MVSNTIRVNADNFVIPNYSGIFTFILRTTIGVIIIGFLIYLLYQTIEIRQNKEVKKRKKKVQKAVAIFCIFLGVLGILAATEIFIFHSTLCFGISCDMTLPNSYYP